MVKSTLAIAFLLLATVATAAHHDGAGGAGFLLVDSVIPDGPAAAAGLQADDRIVTMGDQKIADMDDLRKVIAAHKPGDSVPLTVRRKGETVEMTLTFGEREGGGASMGVSLALMQAGDGGTGGEPGEGTTKCHAWIEQTYRINSLMRDLDLDLSDDYKTMLECVERDTRRMGEANAVKYCDNVFKVHCSGLDLLTEIGEAQVEACEEQLTESLGLELDQYKGWRTCAEPEVFDRYSMDGESSDQDACKAAFLDECGTNIDAAIQAGTASREQRGFVECCSADALDAMGDCSMIDDGFKRGPCHDRPLCVNRLTSEWVQCSVLE